MDLNHLAAFVRVVGDGSFTAAAKGLGLPKSSVSRSVAQLEHDIGVRLLHRTTRRLHLTDAGAAFYDRVAHALGDIDEATSAASEMQTQPKGTVRVTAPVDVGVWALATIVSRFVRAHPTIHVEVMLTNRVVNLAAEGFDLAVRAGSAVDDSLIARRVGAPELGMYASRRYVERRGVPRTLAELAAHDRVVYRGHGARTLTLAGPDGARETVTVEGAVAADDMSFVKKAILAGAGIGLLPDFLTVREEEAGKMVRVLPEWSLAGSALLVVYPSARFVPQRVVLFRDHLVAQLSSIAVKCSGRSKKGGAERLGGRDRAAGR